MAEISQVPKAPVDVDAETGRKVLRLMEALDDHDDVQNVYSNINLSESFLVGYEKRRVTRNRLRKKTPRQFHLQLGMVVLT